MPLWKSEALSLLRAADAELFATAEVFTTQEAVERGIPRVDLCRGHVGPSIAAALTGSLTSFAPIIRDGLNHRANVSTVLHEAAHYVDFLPFVKRIESRSPGIAKEFSTKSVGESLFTADRLSPKPWQGHDGKYLRLLSHIVWRLQHQCDWPGELADCYDAELYLLSPAEDYAVALGDEPERLAGLSLAEVAETPWPNAYKEFAEADLEHAKETFYGCQSRKEVAV